MRFVFLPLIALLLAGCAPNPADAPAAAVRLYVLDCGTIEAPASVNFGLKEEEVARPGFVTPCYLIAHGEEALLWDTGEVPDADIPPGGAPFTVGRYTVTKPLLSQLAEIGYTPEEITYLALSHYHGDHTANANSFVGSTWLVQDAEHKVMFSGIESQFVQTANFAKLKDAKTTILHGDHDIWGDGKVILKSTPGHTEGHQSLFLKLDKTGPVLLSGDLYHYPEERTLDRIPTIEVSQEQTRASRVAMEAFMKESGAKLWIQHDLIQAETIKKSPEFYD